MSPSSPRSSSESSSSRSRSGSGSSSKAPSEHDDDIVHHVSLGVHSTSALVLIPDSENDVESNTFSFSDSDEEAAQAVDDATPETTLPPSLVFVHFLAPCLKLGALLTLTGTLPLEYSIPALFVFSLLSAFARQIWFLLARYLRRADLKDIVADTLVRGKCYEGRKSAVKSCVRAGSALVRLLLAILYLRGSVDVLEPLVSGSVDFIPSRPLLTFVFTASLVPICLATSLSSKRIVYTTWLSIGFYVSWLCAVVYAHSQGVLKAGALPGAHGLFSRDIPVIALAFSTVSTVQLYAGTVAPHTSATGDKKGKRFRSLTVMSWFAALLSALLVLPLLFPLVRPNERDTPTDTDPLPTQALVATLTALVLLSGIPSLIVTAPSPNFSDSLRRLTQGIRPATVSSCALLFAVFLLSLFPVRAIAVLQDIMLVVTLFGSYLLPALLHIIVHTLRKPLSILVPPRTPTTQPPAAPDPTTAELLQRKERALQRRRTGRRALWDAGVWVLLVPVGLGGIVWTCGRLVGVW